MENPFIEGHISLALLQLDFISNPPKPIRAINLIQVALMCWPTLFNWMIIQWFFLCIDQRHFSWYLHQSQLVIHDPLGVYSYKFLCANSNNTFSNNRCHDLDYVPQLFQWFYNHLKKKNTQMGQHLISSNSCIGQFKKAHLFQWLCMLFKKQKVPHI